VCKLHSRIQIRGKAEYATHPCKQTTLLNSAQPFQA
jgi:hypothetical protein